MQSRLKDIFLGACGFQKVIPTDALLEDLGVTRKRFYQLIENKGNQEMTVSEKIKLERWLKRIEKAGLDLFDEASQLKVEN
jgi:hypothetical protein